MKETLEQMDIEMLLAFFSHRELARMYLLRLKETEELRAEIKRLKEGKKDYFTPEEVRKMTRKEVRENYYAIMNSMKKW